MAKTRRRGHDSTAARRVWHKRDNAEARRQANREIDHELREEGF